MMNLFFRKLNKDKKGNIFVDALIVLVLGAAISFAGMTVMSNILVSDAGNGQKGTVYKIGDNINKMVDQFDPAAATKTSN